MLVHIFARHNRSCPHKADPQYKRCRCTRWVTFTFEGKQHRESTRAQSHEQATVYARGVEQRYERILAGAKPKPTGHITVAQAITAYLDDKRAQQLQESTLRKRVLWFEKELLTWCHANAVQFLSDLDLVHLRKWRSSWELGALAMQKKQDIVRQFFSFCVASGWVKENAAKGLSRIKVTPKPTDYFNPDEMKKILRVALEKSRSVPAHKSLSKLYALVLLMRWSGLAIRDAVTLERERLSAEDRIFLYRAKTGVPVHVTIPHEVAEELRSLSLFPNPRYFFWNGSDPEDVVVKHWHHHFSLLFKKVKLIHLDCTVKEARPHMFRDTFAVNLLISGVPMEDVQLYLGHSSIKTTEQHYAPFVQARMTKMDETPLGCKRRVQKKDLSIPFA
jgi:integrase/recombinase XerD